MGLQYQVLLTACLIQSRRRHRRRGRRLPTVDSEAFIFHLTNPLDLGMESGTPYHPKVG